MFTEYDEDDALGVEALVSLQFDGGATNLAHAEDLERAQRGWITGATQQSWGEVPILDTDDDGDDQARDLIRDLRIS